MPNDKKTSIKIGGASGGWGDSPRAIGQLLGADIDYIVMDYLAEVTMSLLAKAKAKNPAGGFPADFVSYLVPHLTDISARGIRVAANAGGVNPSGCKDALEAEIRRLGLNLTVAVVLGDDLVEALPDLHKTGQLSIESGSELPASILSSNAYLGALPIAAAFQAGADIVVTGRCADSALALGILMNEFGWEAENFDLLSAGSLIGHMLECGPQATGGTFTDWDRVPDWHNIGYPIADCSSDGSFVLSKPEGTGGLIDSLCVTEQLFYEIGNPQAYILPDVVADFSQVTVEQVDADHVRVSGARGQAPTTSYKVSTTFEDGFKSVATVSIVGPRAVEKALRTGEELIKRGQLILAETGLPPFTDTHSEALGGESAYSPDSRNSRTRETLLRLVTTHPDKRALDLFAKELGSVGLGFAPGTTGIYTGRPRPVSHIKLSTMFVSKEALPSPTYQLSDSEPIPVSIPTGTTYMVPPPHGTEDRMSLEPQNEPLVQVKLVNIAVARSGDKGNSSNIAVIARHPSYYGFIVSQITAARMAEHFRYQVKGAVERFEAPRLSSVNFLLQDALGGGGTASLRIDPQGKAYGQMTLEMNVSVPAALAHEHGWDLESSATIYA